jgi:hypothetical protein
VNGVVEGADEHFFAGCHGGWAGGLGGLSHERRGRSEKGAGAGGQEGLAVLHLGFVPSL